MMTLRSVRFLFGLGRGKEGLGIGDADVMMMAGAFLGWQPTVLAFFVGVFVALFFGIVQLIRKGDQALAFAPALAIGVMLTLLIWPTVSRRRTSFFSSRKGGCWAAWSRSAPYSSSWRVLCFAWSAAPNRGGGGGSAEGSRRRRDMNNIVIVDYGMANLRSVQKAFEKVGHTAVVSGDPNRVAEADKVVLPGVGAFRDAIARLHEADLTRRYRAFALRQAFFWRLPRPPASFHDQLRRRRPPRPRLLSWRSGALQGRARSESAAYGLEPVAVCRPAPPLAGTPPDSSVYFVHSYYAAPKDETIIATETDYPTPFTSAVWKDNVFATQFHPEKSQSVGLEMLQRFAEWR